MLDQFSNPKNTRIFGVDLLIPLYLAVLIRQCFWMVENNLLAWILTALVALVLWGFHLKLREVEDGPSRPFLLLVVLPLFLVFAGRLAFPDTSFDVLNHRLVQSERALRGPLFIHGDFFPTMLPFNPAPEMLGGIFRHLLGYRAGTIIGFLALVWVAVEVEKLLRPCLSHQVLRSFSVLAVLFTEHMLFEINNYVGDVFSLPLLIAATRRTLDLDHKASPGPYEAAFIALLLGTSLAFKLTNSVMILPILLFFGQELLLKNRTLALKQRISLLATSAVAFALPLLPYCLYIYQRTNSPIFPLYNKLFASPYWPLINIADGRFGPQSTYQTLIWPLLSFFKPERLSELGVYSGRMFLAFLAALAGLLFIRNEDSRLRKLCFIILLSSLLWSLTSGYARYGLYIEALGGVIVIAVTVHFGRRLSTQVWRVLVVGLIFMMSLAQVLMAARYISAYEWSMRPTIIGQPRDYVSELRFLFRDKSLMQFQSPESAALLAEAGTWIVSDIKTNGIEIMLKPAIPIVAVNNEIFFDVPAARKAFSQALATAAGTRMYSLAFTTNIDRASDVIKKRGLGVGKLTPVEIRFFSDFTRLPLTLIEVLPRRPKNVAAQIKELTVNAVLPDEGYAANLSVSQPVLNLRPGQSQNINVKIKNASEFVWMARGDEHGRHPITLRNRWIDGKSEEVVNELDGASFLPRNLLPEEVVEIPITLAAPATPGDYILEFDMVQEQVTWFHQKGSATLRFRVKVE